MGVGWTNTGPGSVRAFDVIFADNQAEFGGGAVCQWAGETTIQNALFVGNLAASGGAIAVKAGTLRVVNGTIHGNLAGTVGGGMLANPSAEVLVVNGILRGNHAASFTQMAGPVEVRYCNVEGGWDGSGGRNIDLAPGFIDAEQRDFRLAPGSSCVDAGNNWAVMPDIDDANSNQIHGELYPYGLDGEPRFRRGDGDRCRGLRRPGDRRSRCL